MDQTNAVNMQRNRLIMYLSGIEYFYSVVFFRRDAKDLVAIVETHRSLNLNQYVYEEIVIEPKALVWFIKKAMKCSRGRSNEGDIKFSTRGGQIFVQRMSSEEDYLHIEKKVIEELYESQPFLDYAFDQFNNRELDGYRLPMIRVFPKQNPAIGDCTSLHNVFVLNEVITKYVGNF